MAVSRREFLGATGMGIFGAVIGVPRMWEW